MNNRIASWAASGVAVLALAVPPSFGSDAPFTRAEVPERLAAGASAAFAETLAGMRLVIRARCSRTAPKMVRSRLRKSAVEIRTPGILMQWVKVSARGTYTEVVRVYFVGHTAGYVKEANISTGELVRF